MVGSMKPLQITRGRRRMEAAGAADPRRRSMRSASGRSTTCSSLYTAGDAKMREFVGEGPILTDDRPAIEYFLALPRRDVDLSGLHSDVREIIRE